jgi:hypothetical protein
MAEKMASRASSIERKKSPETVYQRKLSKERETYKRENSNPFSIQ